MQHKPFGDNIPVTGTIPPPVLATSHIVSASKSKPATVWYGVKIVFGVREPKPIVGAPAGKQRLRMRNGCSASLFIKTADGIRNFSLVDMGETWFCDPTLEKGRNLRA